MNQNFHDMAWANKLFSHETYNAVDITVDKYIEYMSLPLPRAATNTYDTFCCLQHERNMYNMIVGSRYGTVHI